MTKDNKYMQELRKKWEFVGGSNGGCLCAKYESCSECSGLDSAKSKVQTYKDMLEVAESALRLYAAKDEWYKNSSGNPWSLLFNSSSVDGNGYEIAQEALSKINSMKGEKDGE